MAALFSIFKTRRGEWAGCMPPTAAERMAHVNARLASEMQERENAGVAKPQVAFVDGRPTLVAFPTRLNTLPKDKPNVRT